MLSTSILEFTFKMNSNLYVESRFCSALEAALLQLWSNSRRINFAFPTADHKCVVGVIMFGHFFVMLNGCVVHFLPNRRFVLVESEFFSFALTLFISQAKRQKLDIYISRRIQL